MKPNDNLCFICARTLRASKHVYDSGRQAHHKCRRDLIKGLNDEPLSVRFEALVKDRGAYYVEERMHKLDSYRRYHRKWPYDAKKKLVDITDVQEYLPDRKPSLEEALIMTQTTDAYLKTLTPKQKRVVELRDKGYKPQEMANMEGREESGRERWHLHQAKQRLIEFLKGEQGE